MINPGSDKEVFCFQGNDVDQKQRCKKEWFEKTCQNSCCIEACPTEEPTNSLTQRKRKKHPP